MANERKARELGMPWGTACGQLRKAIMFSLVRRLDLDKCMKCNQKIETVEELSIDHVIDWIGVDPALFWDLENVGFSHLICNRPSRRSNGASRRKVGPKGTAWCRTHQAFLSDCEFSRSAARWNGLSNQCKECMAVDSAYSRGMKARSAR